MHGYTCAYVCPDTIPSRTETSSTSKVRVRVVHARGERRTFGVFLPCVKRESDISREHVHARNQLDDDCDRLVQLEDEAVRWEGKSQRTYLAHGYGDTKKQHALSLPRPGTGTHNQSTLRRRFGQSVIE